MAVTFRPITPPDDDELMLLHELNPGYTVERLPDGALLVSPNGASGGMRNVEMSFQLRSWERRVRCGPAFEIVSRTDLREAQLAKCGAYVRNGSALVVLIDPYRRRVDSWRDGVHVALGEIAELDCEPVMPGFVLDVSSILEM
jgi:hypothetical protein